MHTGALLISYCRLLCLVYLVPSAIGALQRKKRVLDSVLFPAEPQHRQGEFCP